MMWNGKSQSEREGERRIGKKSLILGSAKVAEKKQEPSGAASGETKVDIPVVLAPRKSRINWPVKHREETLRKRGPKKECSYWGLGMRLCTQGISAGSKCRVEEGEECAYYERYVWPVVSKSA